MGKPVVFSGHMDTALQPELYEPNAFKIEDGKAYGPCSSYYERWNLLFHCSLLKLLIILGMMKDL